MTALAMNDAVAATTYIIRLEEIAWGIALVGMTLVIHGFGMVATLRWTGHVKRRFLGTPSFAVSLGNLITASWLITLVHLVEVALWAAFFQWHHCFQNFSTAAYFTLMEYTTVGSDYDLPQRWRLLEGMVATSGLLGFAWSTGILMTLAQDFQTQELLRLGRRER
jgi:voltage-gated potassium channel